MGGQAASAAGPGQGGRPFGWSLRDFLVPYILLALSLQRAHGYVIEQYLRGLGLVGVEMSTLYRTLRQLEKDGLVHSSWEPGPDGPARRVYSLTDAGRWWLEAGAAALDAYRAVIDRFFGMYARAVGRADQSEADRNQHEGGKRQ
jgi:poly-beta-hydroxybutyrate-responsive repressor